MKKILPIIFLLLGLAFVAQGAGFLPLSSSVARWAPMVCGWCFILFGVVTAAKNSSKKPQSEPKAEAAAEETAVPEEQPVQGEDTQ